MAGRATIIEQQLSIQRDEEERWRELAIKAQSGNKEAYGTLLCELGVVLTRYSARFLSGFGQSEDCAQEILISIHKSFHTYNSEYKFKPWLFTIAKRRVVDFYRKLEKRSKREISDSDKVAQAIDPHDKEQQQLLASFEQFIKSLPEKYRDALLLTKIQGKSVKEAAAELEISESALNVRVHRGISQLKQKVKKDLGDI